MAADSEVKLQGGPGTWVSWMNHPPGTVKCGENRPDRRSHRLVELSTVSNDCTPAAGKPRIVFGRANFDVTRAACPLPCVISVGAGMELVWW